MKRIINLITLISVLAMIVAMLPACSGKGDADVHVFYYTYSDTYISSVRASLDKKLSDAGISYQDYDASGSQTTQTEQVQTAITKGAKAIIVNLVNTGSDDAAKNIVSKANPILLPHTMRLLLSGTPPETFR